MFTLLCLAQNYYNQPLFSYSLTEEPIIQSHHTVENLKHWEKWSLYGLRIGQYGAIVVTYAWGLSQRHRALYYAIYAAMIFFFVNFMKTAYHQARPFWDNIAITNYGCTTQFGNPSGHSLTSMGSAVMVWLDYYHCCKTKSIPESSIWSQLWMRRLLLFVAITYALSVAWSRILTGMHSFNQILFGMSLGAWLALTFYGLIYEPLLKHCHELLNNKTAGLTSCAVWCTIWYAAMMAIQIVNYLI